LIMSFFSLLTLNIHIPLSMLLGIPFSHIPFELHVTCRCARQSTMTTISGARNGAWGFHLCLLVQFVA
jgi:hypothetical protein